jgi:hypothetical protein
MKSLCPVELVESELPSELFAMRAACDARSDRPFAIEANAYLFSSTTSYYNSSRDIYFLGWVCLKDLPIIS